MAIDSKFIRNEINTGEYEISLHADNERIADGWKISQLEQILLNCEIIEHYPEYPRGVSCLILGFTEDSIPVHVVCGRNRSNHLIIITVYIPRIPKWIDPYTRNR